jgi:hypothetical protein
MAGKVASRTNSKDVATIRADPNGAKGEALFAIFPTVVASFFILVDRFGRGWP